MTWDEQAAVQEAVELDKMWRDPRRCFEGPIHRWQWSDGRPQLWWPMPEGWTSPVTPREWGIVGS